MKAFIILLFPRKSVAHQQDNKWERYQNYTWGMDRIDLAQDKDRWRALVNAVMNLRVHKMQGISWLAENRLASQEILCSVWVSEWVSEWVSGYINTSFTIRKHWLEISVTWSPRNQVFWVPPCGCVISSRRFEDTFRLHFQGEFTDSVTLWTVQH